MSVLVAPLPTPTTPGVEVTSGALTAVVHDGFPGVLLRVLGATGPVTIWRADGAEQIAVAARDAVDAIEVPDAADTCARIKAAGGNVTREAGPVKGGSTVIAFVQDPDGYKVELIQRR